MSSLKSSELVRADRAGAKGAIIVGKGADWGLLAAGTDGYLLTADATQETGIKWARSRQGIIAQSAVAVPLTGSGATEVTLATITIPAGLVGANDSILIDTTWSCTNNANVKTARVRLAGTTIGSVTLTSSASGRMLNRVSNRNATNSQVAFGGSSGSGASSAAIITAAIDMTASQDITLTAQDAGSANAVALEAYRIELQSA